MRKDHNQNLNSSLLPIQTLLRAQTPLPAHHWADLGPPGTAAFGVKQGVCWGYPRPGMVQGQALWVLPGVPLLPFPHLRTVLAAAAAH